MPNIITFTKGNDIVTLIALDDAGKRRALLQAFAANPFTVPEPRAENLTNLTREYVDAYNLPQDVVDAMGPALRADIQKKRDFVNGNLAAAAKKYAAVQLRDMLLGMPVDDAINEVTIENGKRFNVVEAIAPQLNNIFRHLTSDGYHSDDLYTVEAAKVA